MGFDSLSKKLSKATQATQGYIVKKWEERKEHRNAGDAAQDRAPAEDPELVRQREERNAFLRPIAAKLMETAAAGSASAVAAAGSPAVAHMVSNSLAPTVAPAAPQAPGTTTAAAPTTTASPTAAGAAAEMEQPLVFSADTSHRAVLLVTTPIEFGSFELSKQSYRLLARHVGMSLNSVCHWALCVVDRGFGASYCYDLMSDQISLKMLGKNVFRVYEVTPETVQNWSSCYYVGETTKTHDEIQTLGQGHMALNPRYSLLESNCQHLAEKLVRELCDGRIISQDRLDEELSLVSPKIAMDMMMAKVQAKLDERAAKGEEEKQDEHAIEGKDGVKEDMDTIQALWTKVKKHV